MPHFVKLDFQLVNLLQDRSETCDFGVSNRNGIASAVVLSLRGELSLLSQLDHDKLWVKRMPFKIQATYSFHPALDRLHQPVKVVPERLQAARIQ